MRHAITAALLGAALLAGCGGGGETPAASSAAAETPATDTIRIEDFRYAPTPATVRAGQKIAVANDDSAPHTLTVLPASGDPLFDTGNVRGRERGSFTAPKPGTYEYFCELHAFMKGRLVVVS